MNTKDLFEMEILETCGRLLNNAHYVCFSRSNVEKETRLNFEELRKISDPFNNQGSFTAYFWCVSTLYFLFYSLNLQEKAYRKEILYLSNRITDCILKCPEYDINIKIDWAEWQFNYNGLHKEFPPEKTPWCVERLNAFKSFVKTGKCKSEFFPFLLYLLMEKAESISRVSNNQQSVRWISTYCAYIDNEEEFYSNIDNFIINNFYFYCINSRPEEKDLFTWAEKYAYFNESNRTHGNYEHILPTVLDLDTMCALLNLETVFRNKSKELTNLVLRSFGFYFPPLVTTESSAISILFKTAQNLGGTQLSKHPGLVFCMYWSIRFLNYHDFIKLFLENVDSTSINKKIDIEIEEILTLGGKISSPNIFSQKEGISLLQQLFFFLIFELTAKVPYSGLEKDLDKKIALQDLLGSVKTKNWFKTETQYKHFNDIASKCGIKNNPLTIDFCSIKTQTFKENVGFTATEVVLNLLFNIIHLCHTEHSSFLISELNFIREQQRRIFPLYNKKDKLSDDDIERYEKNHSALQNQVDSGFLINDFSQVMSPFENVIMKRNIVLKVFDETDNEYSKNRKEIDYRNHYKNFLRNKYLYRERNMQTHYTEFSPIEYLLQEQNCNDLLNCLYDAEQYFIQNPSSVHYEIDYKNIQIISLKYPVEKCREFRKRIENVIRTVIKNEGPFYNKNGKLFINNEKLKNKKNNYNYTGNLSEEFISELKAFLGTLFAIKNICTLNSKPSGNGSFYSYNENIFDAYGIEIAVYLIKVTLDLQLEIE